jgi:hypothetical protein
MTELLTWKGWYYESDGRAARASRQNTVSTAIAPATSSSGLMRAVDTVPVCARTWVLAAGGLVEAAAAAAALDADGFVAAFEAGLDDDATAGFDGAT